MQQPGQLICPLVTHTLGQLIIEFYNLGTKFIDFQDKFNEWGLPIVFFAGLTPFPYKVLTIFSGATGLNLVTFTVVSIIGRGLRFYLVSWLLYRFGEPIKDFIEKRLSLMFTIAVILLVGGFAAVKFLF